MRFIDVDIDNIQNLQRVLNVAQFPARFALLDPPLAQITFTWRGRRALISIDRWLHLPAVAAITFPHSLGRTRPFDYVKVAREYENRCAMQHEFRCLTEHRALALYPKAGLHFGKRIIAGSHLRYFWEANPGAEQPLKSWVDEVKKANWSQPADIKAQYRGASILKNRRVVFNIKGNDYRLVVSVACRFQAAYVKFIGTHAEYDLIDAEAVEMEP